MKLMIISDIHGSYNDLEKVMHYFDEEQPDRLIILGDILYHGPRNDYQKAMRLKSVFLY